MRFIARLFLAVGTCVSLVSGCQDIPGKNREASPVPGIDLSHFQGDVNFKEIAGSGNRFVFLKASEGAKYTDTKFAANWKAAKDAGLIRGAYHFLHPTVDGAAQARHFLSVVDLAPGDLPPVVDVERAKGNSNAGLADTLKGFLDEVRKTTGVDAIIYVSPAFWKEHLQEHITAPLSNPLWIAEYGVNTPRELKHLPPWTFWQYTNTGSSAGVKGHVDLDYGRNIEAIRIRKN